MKKAYLIVFLICLISNVFGQSILSSSTSKSGILIGGMSDYAGVGFENASSEFTFNYKLNVQDTSIQEGQDFPHYWNMNLGSSIKTDKSKSSLISDEKWQGGIDFNLTFSRTVMESKKIGEEKDDKGVIQEIRELKERTFFLTFSNGFERIRHAQIDSINEDTSFVTLNNPLQNSFTITAGYYQLYQFTSDWHLSWAVSANFNLINRSVRGLAEGNFTPLTGTVLNSKDSTQVIQGGKSDSYFIGTPDNELFFVPRLDFFVRKELGEDKPVLGFVASYSPLISSLESVDTRHVISFGPTFGLSTFPDQIVFTLLNDFRQDASGTFKYSLNFQAVVPFNF